MATKTEPVRRTSEIEEATNRWFVHPAGRMLLPWLVAWRIKPNTVSLLGMGCGLLAGFAYSHVPARPWLALGFLLMVAWHVLDGVDGQLARLTQTQSELGKVLDGVCDYITFIAVYVALALSLAPRDGDWVLWVVALAGACHAVQAAAYEAQRQFYDVWGWGRGSRQLRGKVSDPRRSAFGVLHHLYGVLQHLALGNSLEMNAELGVMLEAAPHRAESLRRRYRETFAPSVRGWAVMSSNYRTAGIFLFAAAGFPMGYFLTEILLLSPMCFWMIRRQNRRLAGFLRELAVAG